MKKTIYIDGKVYPLDECVEFDGQYVHYTHKDIIRDYYTKQYVHLATTTSATGEHGKKEHTIITEGIIRLDDDTRFISSEIAKSYGYTEDILTGSWYKEPREQSKTYHRWRKFEVPSRVFPMFIPSPSFIKTLKKQYKFGIEIETSIGLVPNYLYTQLPMKCVFDGSLRSNENIDPTGGEYVTNILQGDIGLNYINKICLELSRRCKINDKCSVHVHLSTEFTREIVVSLYALCQLLEDELFSMMPLSRSTNPYCNKMQQLDFQYIKLSDTLYIEHMYSKIQDIVACGESHGGKKSDHPKGYHCGYDKTTPRYWWINFVPTLFNVRHNDSYSIEFRNHSASLNFTKIKNWILICMGILFVAENHCNIIRTGITLHKVLITAFGESGQKLSEYVEMRKKIFKEHTDSVEYLKKNNKNMELKISEL